MKINYSLPKVTAFLSFIYLFISFYPFPMWILPGLAVYLVIDFALAVATYLLAVNNRLVINNKRIWLVYILFVFMLHLALPLFDHPPVFFKIPHFFPLIFIIFYGNNICYDIFKYFRLFIIIVSIYSIIIFVLLFIGIDLPYYRVDGFTMTTQYSDDFYRVYGLAVSSTNTVYEAFGFTITRVMGPFIEPGHFAIYLGITISIGKILYGKISKILVIAGFLTFSPAFLIIFLILIFYEIIIQKKIRLLVTFGVFFAILFIIILSDPTAREVIYYLTIGRNFEGVNLANILDERTGGYALSVYREFAQTGQIVMGKGLGSVDSIGMLADYRGLIFKIGLFGTVLSIMLLIILFLKENKKILFLLLPIILLVLAHRSWMFESPYLYVFILLAVNSYKYKNRAELLHLGRNRAKP